MAEPTQTPKEQAQAAVNELIDRVAGDHTTVTTEFLLGGTFNQRVCGVLQLVVGAMPEPRRGG